MDEKEIKKFIDTADANYMELKVAVEGKFDADKVEALKSDWDATLEKALVIDDKGLIDYVKELQTHANGLEEQINDIVQKGQKAVKHPEEELDEFLGSEDYKNAVKMFKGGAPYAKMNALGLQKVLTVGSDLVAGATSPVILPSRDPGVQALPRAMTPLYDRVQKGTTDKDKVSWIERTIAAESAGTAMKAENTAFGESDASWTEVEASVKKITDSFRCTNEMLEDTEFVRSEIMSMLGTNIPHLRETEILSGTNAATTMNGLLTAATAFSLPTGVDSVSDPNAVDGISAAIIQCRLGYNGTNAYTVGFNPDVVVLNPVDSHNLGGLKDSNGLWLLPGYYQGQKNISGVPIVESTDMTVGSYLVASLSNIKYYTRRGMVVRFWDQYDTDPAYDRVMFTATERGCLKVGNIDAYGLVTGTIAAAIAAITP